MGAPAETRTSYKPKRMTRRIDPILIVVGGLTALAVTLIVLVIWVLIYGSTHSGILSDPGAFTLGHFQNVLTSSSFLRTLGNTLYLGFGSMVICLAWAVPFAWLYTRTDLPGKRWLLLFLTVKIAIPSFLVALGYIYLVNPNSGILNLLLRQWLGLSDSVFNVYSLNWIVFLQGTSLATPAFFMMVPAFQALDPSLEEGAYASGISTGRTFFGISLPLLWPAVMAAGLYYAIVAMEIFDYAGMLGLPAQINVFATWIFEMVNPSEDVPKYNEASAIGLLFSLIGVVLMLLYFRILRRSGQFAVVTGKRQKGRTTHLGRVAVIVAWTAITTYAVLEFVLPVSMIVWASIVPYLQPPSLKALQTVSLDGYRSALAELPLVLKNTLTLMIAVPTISVTVAACISWVVVRSSLRGRRMIEILIVSSLGVPSIVVALAFMYLGLSIYRILPIYTTVWIMVVAMSTRYLVWGTRTINSAMLQIHRELEEACQISGVPTGRQFLSIILPIVRPALLFSWFWIALLSVRELTIPIMLSRQDTQVFSTAILGFNAAGNSAIAGAMGVFLMLMVSVMVLVFHRFVGHEKE